MLHNKLSAFLKSWVINNIVIYPLALGIVHPLLSHGFGGDHGKYLTPLQFILHTVAIALFGVLLTIAQNKSLQLINPKCKPGDGTAYYSLLIPLLFWTGYYTLYIPFDILFMMLTIGAINAFRFRSYVKQPGKWVWQSMLTYFLGAVAGISIGLSAFFGGVKDIPGVWRDVVLWLAISTPAGLVVAFVSKGFFKAGIKEISANQDKQQEVYKLQKRDSEVTANAV